MNDDLISIIVPIYNVERYIKQCINSIVRQSYKNIEVILIDDGSKDNSGIICDYYSTKYKQVKVIHKENEGVSVARNIGIELSIGKYITFIDADDFVEPTYVESLYKQCVDKNADLSICGAIDIDDKNKIIKTSIEYSKLVDVQEAIKELLNEKYYSSVVWAKMYRRDLFKNIKFNKDIKIAEDLDVLYRVIDRCNLINIDTSKKLYYYRNRENSATTANYNNDWNNEIKICEDIISFIKNKYPDILYFAIKRYIRINVTCINKIMKNNLNKKEELIELQNNIKKYKKNYLKNNNISIKNKIKYLVVIQKYPILRIIYLSNKMKKSKNSNYENRL